MVGLGLVAAGSGFGAEPKLAVVILDYAGVPAAVLKAAADTARDAFRKVGVETDWSVCRFSRDPHEPCALPPVGTIQVKVLPLAMQGRPQSCEAMGYAVMCPRCMTSYAFYQPVEALARSAEQSVSVVLAFVMVHEVGHLLGMGHSPSGIMKAGLTQRDVQDAAMGRLRFTEGEARLRAAAAEREMALLAASTENPPCESHQPVSLHPQSLVRIKPRRVAPSPGNQQLGDRRRFAHGQHSVTNSRSPLEGHAQSVGLVRNLDLKPKTPLELAKQPPQHGHPVRAIRRSPDEVLDHGRLRMRFTETSETK
jgi:hypothetical protein